MVSKYYDRVVQYTQLPKDIGFDLMEDILAEMEDDGIPYTQSYDLFCKMVDSVYGY